MAATPGNGVHSGDSLPNDINAAVKYITEKMDEIIAIEAKTSGMQADPALVQATSVAGTVKLDIEHNRTRRLQQNQRIPDRFGVFGMAELSAPE